MPANRKFQQISVRNIGQINASVITRGQEFFGRRINIAGDELTGEEAAHILSRVSGKSIGYQGFPASALKEQNPDLLNLACRFPAFGVFREVVVHPTPKKTTKMSMNRNFIFRCGFILFQAAFFRGAFFCAFLTGLCAFPLFAQRYEAEDALVDANITPVVQDANASNGAYVQMKDGNLSFEVTVDTAGFYVLCAHYAQAYDAGGKIQNLAINGQSAGQISFPYVEDFVTIKASAKIKLDAGMNTIGIVKSWGWMDLDYVEIEPYVATPFQLNSSLVTPDPSVNAVKLYQFLLENFQKKVVSGVMTNTVMLNDGMYTPNTVETQTEVAWIIEASGKAPALLGLDIYHGTGLNSDNEWYQGYTNATLSLAADIYNKGGFPTYTWHWKDPSHQVEAFYTESSGNTPFVTFNLNNAFTDTTTYAFNTNSAEYQAILRDIDIVAGYFKPLADQGVPILWRPLHEASGGWFWWGEWGPGAAVAIYKLMFDRMVNHHGLNNLVWVWTSDEAADALDWYPGDDVVDIIGRDYYYYPREANHGSLVASFEKLKEIFEGKKLIALTENGSIPHPDSMLSDEMGWSWFMPWYGEYTMDGWAHDNTAQDWNEILNHDYVITLDEMPGWENYTPVTAPERKSPEIQSALRNDFLEITLPRDDIYHIEWLNLKGQNLATLHHGRLSKGSYRFSLPEQRGAGVLRVRSTRETRLQKWVRP